MSEDGPRGARFLAAPVIAALGLERRHLGGEEAVFALPAREAFLQGEGVVHGGLVATLADTAAVYVVYTRLAEDERISSIEFKLNFLGPATREGGELLARARLLRLGRSVAVVEAEVHQADRPVAKGLFTYLRLPPRSRPEPAAW